MSDPEIEKLKSDIEELTRRVDDLTGEMSKLERSASTFNDRIGDSKNLLGDAARSVGKIRSEFVAFATDSQKQYIFAEKLAETSKTTAVQLGLSVGRSREFTKQFNRATAELSKFGLGASEVSRITTEFAEQSGRARILTPEEILNIGLLEKGLGLSAENGAVLVERMELMGVEASKSAEFINEMVVESQKLGLNAGKVTKVLSNNFDRMSRMSFSNGVKGMTEMAKFAVKMRMDVSDMLGMAEKFYEPEAAIEAAANLQMLGGDIANAFGDPFETMYLARNKPEELAERLQSMTENMMQFNEKTGEYEFPAEARMQLKAAGEQLGINVDSMIDMARQASKIKDIKMNVSGNIQDEDMREGLASMARMKDGKWVVDFGGEELNIDDIGMDKAAEILAAPKDADEAIMDMAYNSMTTNQILENILEALKTGYVAETNVYELTEDILRPSVEGLFQGVEGQVENMLDLLSETKYGEYRKRMLEQSQDMGLSAGEGLLNILETDLTSTLQNAVDKLDFSGIFESDLSELLNKVKDPGQYADKGPGQKQYKDFILRSSGQVTSFTNEDDIIGAKKGGPLDKLMDKGLPNNMMATATPTKMEFGNLNISGRIEIVSPDGSTKNMDMSSLKPQIEKMIINHMNGTFRDGGVSSSKQATDYMG